MFFHLADFGYQRSKKQALGFYLTYALALIVTGGIVGFWAGLVQQQLNHGVMDYQQLGYFGAIVAAIGSAGIAYAIVASKSLKAAYLLVVLLAGISGGSGRRVRGAHFRRGAFHEAAGSPRAGHANEWSVALGPPRAAQVPAHPTRGCLAHVQG